MRRVVMILAGLTVAAVLAYVWRSSASDMSCETTLAFEGVSYTAYEVTEEIAATDDVGVGIERGCGDDARGSEEVAVSRIAGVDPLTALVSPVSAYVLYVAEGVAVGELPSNLADLVAQ